MQKGNHVAPCSIAAVNGDQLLFIFHFPSFLFEKKNKIKKSSGREGVPTSHHVSGQGRKEKAEGD